MYQVFGQNFGKRSEMIIFVSPSATFNVSNSFWGGSVIIPEIGSTLKPNHHNQAKIVQTPNAHWIRGCRYMQEERYGKKRDAVKKLYKCVKEK